MLRDTSAIVQATEIIALVLSDAMRGGARLTVAQLDAVLSAARKYPRVADIIKEIKS